MTIHPRRVFKKLYVKRKIIVIEKQKNSSTQGSVKLIPVPFVDSFNAMLNNIPGNSLNEI